MTINSNSVMIYYFLLIIFIVLGVFFYTKGIISSIRLKRKYNIKPYICIDEIIGHVVIYTLSFLNIGVCVCALFNI